LTISQLEENDTAVYNGAVSPLSHTVSLILTVLLAYVWLAIPALEPFALQGFAVAILLFLILKRLQKAKAWHILPQHGSLEITLLTFAFLILIGATGGIDSAFFSLSYLLLFFLALTTEVPTAIGATVAIMLFYYGLSGNFDMSALETMAGLPLGLLVFLFAKSQYDEAHLSKALLVEEENELELATTEASVLEKFVGEFLEPRLTALEEAGDSLTPSEIITQLGLLRSEITKQLERLKPKEK